ncbi:MAG: hypothetical protein PVTTEEND_000533 [Candidatus Fervidibacter sp.]
MKVINWKAVQIAEQDLMQALGDASDEQDLLKRIVICLFKQRDLWESRGDSFGLTQIVWHQEQTNKLLTDVLSVLKAPRKTEADEMRERGDEAYRNAINARRPEDRQQWMNVALQAYADCVDKNPSDFSALYSIGTILFYERGISEEAITAFRMAATFAEPYSSYHAALAWLQLGYIRRCRKEMEQAYEATEEAMRLQPDWAETHFQHAISCALTDRLDEMKESLKRAVRLDRNYWFRACTEPDLMAGRAMVRELVRATLEELRQEASQEAADAIASAQAHIAELSRLIQGVVELNLPASSGIWHKEQAEKLLNEARQLKAQETYFELLDAIAKAKEVQQICEQGITSLSEEAHNAVNNKERELEAELLARKQEYETELKALGDRISQALKQAEESERELSNQRYALRSEKQKLLDEAKEEEKKMARIRQWYDRGSESWHNKPIRKIRIRNSRMCGCFLQCYSRSFNWSCNL